MYVLFTIQKSSFETCPTPRYISSLLSQAGDSCSSCPRVLSAGFNKTTICTKDVSKFSLGHWLWTSPHQTSPIFQNFINSTPTKTTAGSEFDLVAWHYYSHYPPWVFRLLGEVSKNQVLILFFPSHTVLSLAPKEKKYLVLNRILCLENPIIEKNDRR